MTTSRAHWISELSAAAPTAASAEEREAFATAVISRLGAAHAQGRRAENAYQIERGLRLAVCNVRIALRRLSDMIENDTVSADRNGLSVSELETSAASLLSFFDRANEVALDYEANWRDSANSRPRRGRKNRTAIEIAEMIATEYDRHFGKPAGRSKQADKNNPFFRACKVVEHILDAAGYKDVSLGDDARTAGINRACAAALREMLGMGPLDTYVVADPRATLI